ncbi:fungal-specific transcription factor domain-containing protein [Microdochium trichocladiopsis]|uniref:Fungal-specific transcription factor domain-containing protein n=1 Tax=Microdochium trichocladiopsis TaxID=1682393 RepID=A0A9P8Y4P2_9PEZI|nr:fungal-specific transcription factor domain-containing protein [Microdochium trichocladiopsis]KAH7029673.1 fungal-specific transcription factor domain-containing protein [Microdochium trichocladiopsis]
MPAGTTLSHGDDSLDHNEGFTFDTTEPTGTSVLSATPQIVAPVLPSGTATRPLASTSWPSTCWEYPTFASLSKQHFLKDFRDGRQRYCSSILVNALLALGCRFADQDNTYADHFFEECLRLLYLEEDQHQLTTIQALGILGLREARCGRNPESRYYSGQSIHLAFEMGLHRTGMSANESDETAVQAATFWGAFALEQYVALFSSLHPTVRLFRTEYALCP